MSIHKSKGLEFPVVFVSGMGKQFNLQDARSKLIVHEDLGLGADYIDINLRMKKPTLRKRAIQKKIALESLGEELRVLYVAFTRAKEKLILTGFVKKLEDSLVKWEKSKERDEEKISYMELSSANSYFSWVGNCLFYPNSLPVEIKIKGLRDFVVSEVEKEVDKQFDKEALLQWDADEVYDETLRSMICSQLTFAYPYGKEQEIPAKFSVSELKSKYIDNDEAEVVITSETVIVEDDRKINHKNRVAVIPKFMSNEVEESPTARGILYHKVMQEIRFDQIATIKDVECELEWLVQRKILTEEQVKSIDCSKIYAFFKLDVAKQMKQAYALNKLYREKQFVMGVPACSLPIESKSKELVLIQGIIDAFYETEDGLVLVDYKTDYIPKGGLDEFIKKYSPQIDCYALSLNKTMEKEVKEKYLYSFYLSKLIKL